MLKFAHSSPWPRVFVEDPAEGLAFFSYEGQVGLPRVIVSERPEVRVQDFGDHVNIVPIKMENMEQFESLATHAVLKAHEIAGKTFQSLNEGANYIEREIDCGLVRNILISKEDTKGDIYMTIFNAIQKLYPNAYLL